MSMLGEDSQTEDVVNYFLLEEQIIEPFYRPQCHVECVWFLVREELEGPHQGRTTQPNLDK
jgi:hypothetical protein